MDFENNILINADDFYNAYQRCLESKNSRVVNGVTVSSYLGIPAIVNAAFACELYLKSMIMEVKRCHDLKEFYDLVPQSIKNMMRREYKKAPIPYAKTIEDAIEKVKDTFIDWRYLYEDSNKDQCNPSTLNEYLNIFATILPIIKEAAHKYSS